MANDPVDSILVVSFGGPEGPDDVLPFLRNVTRGRGVPDERLAEVAEHYLAFGGKSPINDQVRALIAALEDELERSGPALPIYWGNRNWEPMLEATLRQMAEDGRRHAVAFVTSAYSSYSSCRQYREDISRARQAAGDAAPVVTKIRQFYNHPGFIEPMIRNTAAALDRLPASERASAQIAFSAHSIPIAAAAGSRYEAQLREAARLIVEGLGEDREWELVFQSRSGPPTVPWLEPDIGDHLRSLHEREIGAVVVVPVGFISDHMEVVYDLDTEAKAEAGRLGMTFERAATVGTDRQFVAAVRELIAEQVDGTVAARTLGLDGVVGCLGDGCCLPATAQSAEPRSGTLSNTAPEPLDVR